LELTYTKPLFVLSFPLRLVLLAVGLGVVGSAWAVRLPWARRPAALAAQQQLGELLFLSRGCR